MEYGLRFGMWNIRSLYRAGSLVRVSEYRLDLVGVQEELARKYTFFYRKGNEIMN
jgi:hypothetical protein